MNADEARDKQLIVIGWRSPHQATAMKDNHHIT
jgi:hypothetical protein